MNKAILLGGSAAFIPTFENAAYGIEWTKDDNDIIRIGNGGGATYGSKAGSGTFYSLWVRSDSNAYVGFFTTVKLD